MRRVLACLLLACATAGAFAQEVMLVNGLLAVVNNKVITYKDVEGSILQELAFLERRYANQPKELDKQKAALRAERLEEMVEHNLVLQEFNSFARPLPESYIENRINEDIKKKFGDRLTLTQTLQAEGMTWESYREKIKEMTILELMWHSKVPPDPVISPTKIENYYLENRDKFQMEDQVQLRLIVMTNANAMDLAREIARKIDDGAPFAEMARVYSQSPSAAQGGDMGKMDRKALRDELATVAFTLPPGKRSDPIQVGPSVFLLFVESRESAHVRSLSEVRQEIEDTLKVAETKRLRKQFVDRLKKKSLVRYF